MGQIMLSFKWLGVSGGEVAGGQRGSNHVNTGVAGGQRGSNHVDTRVAGGERGSNHVATGSAGVKSC